MSGRTILVTGGGGQLASDFGRFLSERGDAVVAPPHAELDVTDERALDEVFAAASPDLVVNCAAFHNLDECERDPETAWRVNVAGPQALAHRCGDRVPLVHFSTNYVFAGDREDPYRESDLPAPESVYAITKLAGEHAVLAYSSRSLVVRTAGLYGSSGSRSKGGNFVQRMLARADELGELKMVADQSITPTYTPDLVVAVEEMLDAEATGVVHLTNSGPCSWFDFTVEIMRRAGRDVPIEPLETSPDGVARPRNGLLVSERPDTPRMRPWQEALAAYLKTPDLLARS